MWRAAGSGLDGAVVFVFHSVTIVAMIPSLPNELLSECFSRGTVDQLLCCARVCVKWRAVAHRCPLYWRSIRLAALSASALAFFCARLDSSSSPGITVIIFLANAPAWEGHPEKIVYRALVEHLSRIAILMIFGRSSIISILLHALKGPAPVLKVFRLRIIPRRTQAMSLPPTMFSDHATPRLRHVELTNVKLNFDHHFPKWLSLAHSVYIAYHPRCQSRVPADLFNWFSEARMIHAMLSPSVAFTAPSCRTSRAKPFDCVINDIYAGAIRAGSGYGDPLDLLDHAEITGRLGVVSAPSERIHRLFQHFPLGQPLQLIVDRYTPVSSGINLDVQTVGISPELSRHFTIEDRPPAQVMRQFEDYLRPILGRIVRLQLTLKIVPLLGCLVELPNCKSLAVIHGGDSNKYAAAPWLTRLSLPALQIVDVIGVAASSIVPEDFMEFLRVLLPRQSEQGEGFVKNGASTDDGYQFVVQKL